jgi:phosphoribosylformimino-5-aminoimidazole carboxamide ribotide isomerase
VLNNEFVSSIEARVQVLPVLDLLGGQVVRGIAGRREEYRPIVSRLCADARPASVARALVEQFRFAEAYVADLDAIAGRDPDWASYEAIADCGLRLWVDAGLTGVERARAFVRPEAVRFIARVIVGLESLARREALAELLTLIGRERLVFSLDLRHGRPITRVSEWRDRDPVEIARDVFDFGVRSMVVLDLARVGVGAGVGTEALARSLRTMQPAVELIGGGGVRGADDLRSLAAAGYDAALVASALHDGRVQMRNGE